MPTPHHQQQLIITATKGYVQKLLAGQRHQQMEQFLKQFFIDWDLS